MEIMKTGVPPYRVLSSRYQEFQRDGHPLKEYRQPTSPMPFEDAFKLLCGSSDFANPESTVDSWQMVDSEETVIFDTRNPEHVVIIQEADLAPLTNVEFIDP